jgi:hypothetical protein
LLDQTYLSNLILEQAEFYKEILDAWNYNSVTFQVKWSLGTYYFKRSKLLEKSGHISQTRSLCTVWDIFGAIGGTLLRFKLFWKLDISSFPTIYSRPNNSSRREIMTCLKSKLKIYQECANIRDLGYMEEFQRENLVFIYLFYFE